MTTPLEPVLTLVRLVLHIVPFTPDRSPMRSCVDAAGVRIIT